jgi:hypothetical protein
MKKIIIAVVAVLLVFTVSAQYKRAGQQPKRIEDKLNEMYATGLFKTTDGTILDVASNNTAKGYLNILDWLQGRVAGLQVYTSRSGVPVPYIRGGVPGIYVDEMLVSASYLNVLSINDIAMVKIIKTPFYGGFNGGNGAIAIYTLGGEEDEDEEQR